MTRTRSNEQRPYYDNPMLSVHARHVLINQGITESQFLTYSREELRALPGVGEKTLIELLELQQWLDGPSRDRSHFSDGYPFLSVRGRNVLIQSGITLEDFIDVTMDRLMSLRNCGAKTTAEIVRFQEYLSRDPSTGKTKCKQTELTLSTTMNAKRPAHQFAETLRALAKKHGLDALDPLGWRLDDLMDKLGARSVVLRQLAGFKAEWYLKHLREDEKDPSCGDLAILTPENLQKVYLKTRDLPFAAILCGVDIPVAAKQLRSITRKIGEFPRSGFATLQEELDFLLPYDLRNRVLSVQRFLPWGDTLESLGEMHNLTRERVRQIAKKTASQLIERYRFTRSLLSHLRVLKDQLMGLGPSASRDRLYELVRTSHGSEYPIADDAIGVVCLLALQGNNEPDLEEWQALGDLLAELPREADRTIQTQKVLLSMSERDRRRIHKTVNNAGAVNVYDVAELLGTTTEDARAVLAALELRGIESDWFGFRELQNAYNAPLIDGAARIHSVAGPVPIDEVYLGLQKHARRSKYVLAPMSVVSSVLVSHGCTIDSDNRLHVPSVIEPRLSGVETAFVRCVDSNGPVVSFWELYQAIVIEHRYSFPALSTSLLRTSVIVDRLTDTGRLTLYGLRGRLVTADDIERARMRQPNVSGEFCFEYTATGNRLDFNATQWLITSGVVSIASPGLCYPEWELMVGGRKVGKVYWSEPFLYGISPAVRSLGIELGEKLRFDFDMTEKTATLERNANG